MHNKKNNLESKNFFLKKILTIIYKVRKFTRNDPMNFGAACSITNNTKKIDLPCPVFHSCLWSMALLWLGAVTVARLYIRLSSTLLGQTADP